MSKRLPSIEDHLSRKRETLSDLSSAIPIDIKLDSKIQFSPVSTVPLSDISEEMPFIDLVTPVGKIDFDTLKADIDAVGLVEPITLYKKTIETGMKYQLLDGHHRFRAVRDLGINQVLAKVVISDMTFEERTAYAVRINLIRRQLSKKDKERLLVTHFSQYLGKNNKGDRIGDNAQEKIGNIFGVSRKTVNRASNIVSKTREATGKDQISYEDFLSQKAKEKARVKELKEGESNVTSLFKDDNPIQVKSKYMAALEEKYVSVIHNLTNLKDDEIQKLVLKYGKESQWLLHKLYHFITDETQR